MQRGVDSRLSGLIEQRKGSLLGLLSQPRRLLASLAADEVPEENGVYLICEDKSVGPIYIGVTTKPVEEKPSGKPSGLRFRIMENHRGKVGEDNFLRVLSDELGAGKRQAVEYVKEHCSCQWLVVEDTRERFLLEHFAIAVLDPRLNKG